MNIVIIELQNFFILQNWNYTHLDPVFSISGSWQPPFCISFKAFETL